MKVETSNGEIVEISETIEMETKDFEWLAEEVKRLKDENAVLIDAAKSNPVLRSNAEKSKKANKFQRNSAQLYRKAAKALWRTFAIEVGQINDDGTRALTLTAKENGDRMEIFIPAERAAYIERVFKPDGTFANREDVLEIIRQKDAEIRRLNCEEDDE